MILVRFAFWRENSSVSTGQINHADLVFFFQALTLALVELLTYWSNLLSAQPLVTQLRAQKFRKFWN
jgi:hypothetical protein